jgi:hypothetical protein
MREMSHQRGQVYTLQGVIGAVIVVSSVILGLQAVDIAAFTADDREATELRVQANDALDIAADADALRAAVTCVAGDGRPSKTVVLTEQPTTEFGRILNETIAETSDYRILIDYPANETIQTVGIDTSQSRPRDTTVTATRQIALFDLDPVREPGRDCRPRIDADGEPITLAEEDNRNADFYLENQDENSELFAVVRIRVVVW